MNLGTQEATQSTTFYLALQNCKSLDLRDNRGKKHDMAFILLGLVIALFRKRDGVLSSIHRSMVNVHSALCMALGIDNERIISRSHLPVLLKGVDVTILSNLIFTHFGLELSETEKSWFSIDGKELRGTIATGNTRGEAIVQVVRHQDRQVLSQGYYNGSKESEQPVVRSLLQEGNLASQRISMDALHFNPATLKLIAESGGAYIVGIKGNQEEIQEEIKQLFTLQKPHYVFVQEEKGHGRQEKRSYCCIDVRKEYFHKRWAAAQFTTAIKVVRTRYVLSEQSFSSETSYYMSNKIVSNMGQANELYKGIRSHWSVEVNNHIRDVSFKEDALQTKFTEVAHPLSLFRTLIINILQEKKINNITKKLEEFMDNFTNLIAFLKDIKFL